MKVGKMIAVAGVALLWGAGLAAFQAKAAETGRNTEVVVLKNGQAAMQGYRLAVYRSGKLVTSYSTK